MFIGFPKMGYCFNCVYSVKNVREKETIYTDIINIEQIMAEGVELGAFFIYSSSSHKIVNRRVFWCNIKRI